MRLTVNDESQPRSYLAPSRTTDRRMDGQTTTMTTARPLLMYDGLKIGQEFFLALGC